MNTIVYLALHVLTHPVHDDRIFTASLHLHLGDDAQLKGLSILISLARHYSLSTSPSIVPKQIAPQPKTSAPSSLCI
jgi:hypothetical protein